MEEKDFELKDTNESYNNFQETYVSLEELELLLSESGYMFYGHGTGRMGNSDEIVDSIFSKGLRTKDNSLYFTTSGLSVPTPELKSQYRELGLPEPTFGELKKQFNNWPHLDSKKIIIARLPIEYINFMADRSDIDGEMFGAFYLDELQSNGNVTYYLNPKFILGCYDVEKQAVRINKNFEKVLSSDTTKELKEKYKIALQKTNDRIDRLSMRFKHNNENNEIDNYDLASPTVDSSDEFDWDVWENEDFEEGSKRI